MIRVISAERVHEPMPGEWWKALLSADEELDDNYITGADVEGMGADDRLAAGSVLIAPGYVYVAYEPELFIQRG